MQVGVLDTRGENLRRRLHAILIAQSDILAAQRATQLFIDEVDDQRHPLFYSFQEVIIVSYARPFIKTRNGYALSDKYVKSLKSSVMTTLHAELLAARNQYIAHSDADSRTIVIYPIGSRLGDKRALKTSYIIKNQRFPISAFPRILELCQGVGENIDKEKRQLFQKLWPHTDTPGGPFNLLSGASDRSHGDLWRRLDLGD